MKFHDELCEKIFNGEDLKPEVSEKLLEIADAFIEFLEVPTDAIKDVVITGSMVSYNYTQYSDIDLHLKVDFDKIHKDCPIVQGYLWQSKAMFNKNHDITIYGIPVEVYAESIEEDTVHNGLYSLWQDKWIDFPEKIEPTDNDSAVEAKFNEFKDMADNINDSEEAEALIDKLYIMRKAGLEEVGEFSTENLAFKKVRDAGILERLKEMKKEKIDKQLSLESYNEGISVSDYLKLLKDNGTLTDTEGAEYLVQAFNDGKLEVIAGYKDIEKAAKRFLDICGKYDKAVFKQLFDNGKDIKVLDSDHKELNEMPKYLSYVNESIKKAESLEINEGMWASPFTMENAKQIAELLAKPITYEELNSEEGKQKYWNIIGDDEFWDNVADDAFDIPESDARYLIVKFLEDWMERKEDFNADAYSQEAEDIIKKAIFMFNGITEDMGKSIKEDRLFNKQLTPLPSKDAKLNKGDKVTIDGQNGEIIEVRPMKMSDTCTYKIKLDNGKVIWRYEEEIINEDKTLKNESILDKVSNRGLYVALLEQPYVKEHLKKSVEARQAEDPDAKVGDTIIDSDRLISLFSDKLKPSDYKDFNAEIAEELLFDELHKIEREYGFKENTDEDYDSLYDKVDTASSDLKELINELPQFFEESYKDGIYNIATIGKALQMEKEFLDSVETVDGRADSIMSFIIPDGKTLEKTILTKRDKVKEYKPQENEYFLDMVRDTGWWTTDYNLAPMQTLVNRWNGIMENCENQRSGIMENYVQPYELYLYKKASPENQAKGEEYDLVKAPHFDTEQEMRDYLQGVKDQYDSYEMRKREKDGSLGYIAEDVATLTDKIDKADNDLEELLKNLTSSIHEALDEKSLKIEWSFKNPDHYSEMDRIYEELIITRHADGTYSWNETENLEHAEGFATAEEAYADAEKVLEDYDDFQIDIDFSLLKEYFEKA